MIDRQYYNMLVVSKTEKATKKVGQPELFKTTGFLCSNVLLRQLGGRGLNESTLTPHASHPNPILYSKFVFISRIK